MNVFRISFEPGFNPTCQRHVHDGHELLAVVAGAGVQLSTRSQTPCTAGDLFVFPAGSAHLSVTGAGQTMNLVVLQCGAGDLADGRVGDGGWAVFDRLAERCPDGGRLPTRPAVRQRVVALLDRAAREQATGEAGARCLARALVMEALVALDRQGAAPTRTDPDAGAQHVELARDWISRHWMLQVRIADLVALGPLGRSQFLAAFRARTGQTVGQAVREERLRAAEAMLVRGDVLVDVALASGFANQSHFTRVFARARGCAPGAWRQRRRRAAPELPAST